VFTHTPTFATHKTTFGACKTVKLRLKFFDEEDGMALRKIQGLSCG
jgi:hypothetical protein